MASPATVLLSPKKGEYYSNIDGDTTPAGARSTKAQICLVAGCLGLVLVGSTWSPSSTTSELRSIVSTQPGLARTAVQTRTTGQKATAPLRQSVKIQAARDQESPLKASKLGARKSIEVTELSKFSSPSELVDESQETVASSSWQGFSNSAMLFGMAALAGVGGLVMKLRGGQSAKSMDIEGQAEGSESTASTLLTRFVALPLAFFMAFLPAMPAEAARSGGRMGGGGGFAARRAAPSRGTTAAPPLRSGPTVRSNTNIYVMPSRPAYGFGMGYGYGGFGYGGFGPMLTPGQWLGLNALDLGNLYIQEQRRQAFIQQQLEQQRQLGRDQAEIAQLERQMLEQQRIMAQLQAQVDAKGVQLPPPQLAPAP